MKKYAKRLAALALSALMVLALAACGGGSAGGKTTGIYLTPGRLSYANMRPQYNYYLTTFDQQEITLMDDNTYCLLISSACFSALELDESTNDAKGNGVDRDAAGRKLFGQGFGQPVHAGLCGGISGFTGSACRSPHGRDVDDPSGMSGNHVGNGFPAAVEDGRQIGREDPVPLGIRHIHQKTDVRDAGIIDQDIDAAADLTDFLENLPDSLWIACIARHQMARRAAGILNFLFYLCKICKRRFTI